MLIAQITDLHIGVDPGNPEEANMQRIEAVLRRLTEGPNRPDLLLMTGDLTESGDAESYARLARTVSGCPFPVWPIVGNHDARGPFLEAFPQTPREDGFVQYVIEGDGLRLVLLDTLEEGRHGGAFCAKRVAWLNRQLAAAPQVPTVIVMHHPPFASGIDWLDGDACEPWMARFADAIAGHGQVRAILCGHLHRTIQTLWNGAALTVCASTAPLVALDLNPVDPDRPDLRAMITREPPTYALHRWDGERLVSHFESIGVLDVLARYDASMQEAVRAIRSERRGR